MVIESFTQFSRKILNLSAQEASRLGHNIVDTEHMLIAISRQDTSLSAKILSKHGLDTATLIDKVLEKNEKGKFPSNIFSYSEDIKGVLENSVVIARSLEFDFVGIEHVLISILSQDNLSTKILNDCEIYQDTVIEEVMLAKQNFDVIRNKMNEKTHSYYKKYEEQGDEEAQEARNIFRKAPKLGKFIDKYTTNISNLAENKDIDYATQRDEEIDRLIQVLSRRTRNNPILIGEAGVGKTAIVHSLAYKISRGEVPVEISDKKILRLDISSVVSGAKYNGELEERVKNIIEDIKNNGNIILFIDNFQSVAIMSNREVSAEAGNLIKVALEQSEIQIIGATSISDYKKYIERDDMLKRRVQSILVKEPTKEQAVKMIKSIKSNYELYHDVKICDDIIELAVKLSNRYIHDKYLPDKAIDILDEASSKKKLSRDEGYYEINKIYKKIEDAKVRIKIELRENNMQKVSSINDEIEELEEVLSQIPRDKIKNYEDKKSIFAEDIENIVSVISGVPLERLSATQEEKLLNMQKNISSLVIGQENAVSSVVKAIQRAKVGLKNPNKPIGSFIFVGPTGVGKTRLAKMLAKELFDDENSLIRVDMSEYAERHTVSKLIGSPPGYVGYSEGGQLTEKIKKKPYCILLFDEIEKAHGDIFDVLLQVLDDGYLTDAQGKKVDFKNTIIIMTSNIGAKNVKQNNFGFIDVNSDKSKNEEKIFLSEVKKYFKPEFINRIDEMIVFNSLGKKDIQKIVKIMIDEINDRLIDKDIAITIDDTAIKCIVADGYSDEYGARQLSRTIQKLIEDEIAIKMLKKEIKNGDKIKIYAENDKIEFDRE